MLKRFLVLIFIAVMLFGGIAGTAWGQENNIRDLKDYKCKDTMRLSGEDRSVAIGVLHAYLLGKKGTTQFDVQKLTENTDKFVDHCLDNPNDNALETMEKITK